MGTGWQCQTLTMLQPSATRTGKQRTAKTPRRLAVLRWLWWLHDFTLGAALSPLSYIYLQYLTGRGMGGYIAVSPTELARITGAQAQDVALLPAV